MVGVGIAKDVAGDGAGAPEGVDWRTSVVRIAKDVVREGAIAHWKIIVVRNLVILSCVAFWCVVGFLIERYL